MDSEADPRAASDSECSEDSAVFAAPSPPVLNQSKNKIVKSTSETDILFTMKRVIMIILFYDYNNNIKSGDGLDGEKN